MMPPVTQALIIVNVIVYLLEMMGGMPLFGWFALWPPTSGPSGAPDFQVWQLVTYVQALRGDRPIASPPGPREDHLQAGEGRPSR